ncbi:MAG TPA: ABC transporter ATP-binding protein [Polyangiaceae bacterium]|nr:ABC transporter ATP-binding protein [Polyangiaceae bacterium]
MIEASELTKDYGSVVAVRDVSFNVGKGEIVGFLGPNGAGKSTTLRMLSGFLGPTRGRVVIGGFDMQRHPLAAKRLLGYMPEAAPLYPEMRVREYLLFRARLKRVAGAERKRAVDAAMDRAAVADVADTLVAHLSKGYRQRVALADALVAAPPLLILDEPTAGLDPNQIRDVRSLIRELGKSHTVLLSTHIWSEVEAMCDRALVIDRGRLVAEGTLLELTALVAAKTLVAEVRDPHGRALAIARDVPGVSAAATLGEAGPLGDVQQLELSVTGARAEVAERVVASWVAAEIGVRSLTAGKASLEEVFTALTAERPAAAATDVA